MTCWAQLYPSGGTTLTQDAAGLGDGLGEGLGDGTGEGLGEVVGGGLGDGVGLGDEPGLGDGLVVQYLHDLAQ